MADPTYATTSAAIAGQLSTVDGIGRIHQGERHVRDERRLRDLFGCYVPDAAGRVALRGWIITRDEMSEDWWTQTRTEGRETWTLTGLQGVTKGLGAEASFQALADRVWESFRGITTLGDLTQISAATTPTLGYATLAKRLCYTASIRLEASTVYSIGSDATTPVGQTSTADTREGYSDAAGQIAGQLASVTDAGRVHAERVWTVKREELIDRFTEEAEGLLPGKRVVRSWQVYRDSDAEQRGLGNRVEATTVWKLQAARSWSDAALSYEDTQAHVDAVAARFRQLPNLGSLQNATQVLSTPLQVREIGARSFGGTITHFIDGELAITEVCHA